MQACAQCCYICQNRSQLFKPKPVRLLTELFCINRFTWSRSERQFIHQRDLCCLHGHASHQYSFLISHFYVNESRKFSKVTDWRFLCMAHQLSEIGRHLIYTPINPAGMSLTQCNTTINTEYFTSAVLGLFSVIITHAFTTEGITSQALSAFPKPTFSGVWIPSTEMNPVRFQKIAHMGIL